MAVYVDDAKIKFRRYVMCHMIADSDAELMEFAEKLGLRPEWKHNDHFDISLTYRTKAVELGAIEITQHELVEKSLRLAGNHKSADRVRRYIESGEDRQGGLFG